jgi:hypothetical protein
MRERMRVMRTRRRRRRRRRRLDTTQQAMELAGEASRV